MSSPVIVPINNEASATATANLESLSKSVGRWLNRTDLAEVAPDFIRMAESEFSRDTRMRSGFQVIEVSGYTPDGEIALPADMLELQELRVEGSPLKEMPFESWRTVVRGPYFARVGNVVHITGKPAAAYKLTYLQKLPQLVFATDSNWLLREHYDIYLWKCCELGSVWMRDAEAAQGYNQKYELAVQNLLTANNYHAWGGALVAVQAPGVT